MYPGTKQKANINIKKYSIWLYSTVKIIIHPVHRKGKQI